MLKGRAGRNNGLNSRGERERKRGRGEGGVEERRERWEVRGGEKGWGQCYSFSLPETLFSSLFLYRYDHDDVHTWVT